MEMGEEKSEVKNEEPEEKIKERKGSCPLCWEEVEIKDMRYIDDGNDRYLVCLKCKVSHGYV